MNKYRRFNNRLLKAKEAVRRPDDDFKKAAELCSLFLEMNNITVPTYIACYLGGGRGLYTSGRKAKIQVSPGDCHWLGWSKPGNKADITTFGVTAHETAHHLEFTNTVSIRHWWKYKHKPVTSYARVSVSELLAEAGRLFILSPTLLRAISPNSYQAFVDAGLRHGKE